MAVKIGNSRDAGHGRGTAVARAAAAVALGLAGSCAGPNAARAADLAVPSGTYSLNGQTQTFGVVSNTGGALQVGTGTLNAGTLNTSGGSTTVDLGGRINVGAGGLNVSGPFPNLPLITLADGSNPSRLVLGGNVSASVPGGLSGPPVISGGIIDLGGVERTFNVIGQLGAGDSRLGIGSAIVNGGLLKTGNGALRIASNSLLQYAGVTRITGGTLELGFDVAGLPDPFPNRVIILDGGNLSATRFEPTWDITVLSGRVSELLALLGGSDQVTVGTFRFNGGTTKVDNGGFIQATTMFMSGGSNRCTQGFLNPAVPLAPINGGRVIVGTGGLHLTGDASPQLDLDVGEYPGRLVLGGNVTFAGAAGTATIASTAPGAGQARGRVDLGAAARTFTVAEGSAPVDVRISAEVANGSLVKSGAGLLQLTAPNTYAGGTTINQGTVEVLHTAGLGTGPVTLGDGTLSVVTDSTAGQSYGNDVTVAGDGRISATTLNASAPGGEWLHFGKLSVAAGRTFHADSGPHLIAFDGAVTLPAAGAATLDVAGGYLLLYGNLAGGAGTALNKTGPGRLDLRGTTASSFAGTVNVYAGTLLLDNGAHDVIGDLTVTGGATAALLGAGSQIRDAATVTLTDGTLNIAAVEEGVRNLNLNKGTVAGDAAAFGIGILSPGVVTVTGNVPSTISANLNVEGVRTFAVNDAAATLNVTGTVRDNNGVPGGGINKTGAGRLNLRGTTGYSFTGPVTASGGTLELNNTVGNIVGDLTVTGGAVAVLGQPSQIRDTVTLANGTLDLQFFAEGIFGLNLNKGTVAGDAAGFGMGLLSPGSITVTGAAASTISANLNVEGVRTVAVNDPAATLTVARAIRDNNGVAGGGINKSGPGLLVLAGAASYTGPTTVNGGTVRVTGSIAATSGVTVNAGGTFDAAATQSVKALVVSDGGLAKVSASAAGVTVLTVGDNTTAGPMALAGTGRLDLGANALIVDYAPGNAAADAAAVASVRGRVVAAYHGGDWLGAGGVGSSVAAADHARAVGYALASDVPGVVGGAFLGRAGVDASSVVARLTLAGDATLDGRVDFNDLVPLAQNYNAAVSAATESWWARGDFNYDGRVDFDDLVRLAQNYNAALPGEPVPGAVAGFERDASAAFAAVPEPGGMLNVGVAVAACLLGRRRRGR